MAIKSLPEIIKENQRRATIAWALAVLNYVAIEALGAALLVGSLGIGLIVYNVNSLDNVVLVLATVGLIGGMLSAFVVIPKIAKGLSRSFVRSLNLVTDDPTLVQVRNIADELTIAMHLEVRPAVVLLRDKKANAVVFDAGDGVALIAVTTGLIELLSRAELEVVMASLICSVASFEARSGTRAILIASRTLETWVRLTQQDDSFVKTLIFYNFLAAKRIFTYAALEQPRFSDFLAIDYTRNPYALVSALRKLDKADCALTNAPWWYASFCYVWPSGDGARFPMELGGFKIKPKALETRAREIEDELRVRGYGRKMIPGA